MSKQDHARIYLQHCDDGGVGGADEGRSFCVDRVDVNGVPDTAYVRADLYDTLTAENERLQTDVQELATVREQVRAALRGEPIVGYDEAEQVVRLQAIVDKLHKTADNDTWTRGHDAGHEAGWAAAMEAAAKVCEHYSHGHHKAGHSVLALGRNAAEEIRRLAAQPAQPEPCKTCGGKPRGVLHPDGGWVPCPACQQPKPCGACYRSPYPDNPCESCVFQCWTPNHHPTQPVREYCSHDPLPEGLINVYFDSPWNAKVDPHGSCGYFKPDWQRAEEDAELQGPDCQQPEQEGETK